MSLWDRYERHMTAPRLHERRPDSGRKAINVSALAGLGLIACWLLASIR